MGRCIRKYKFLIATIPFPPTGGIALMQAGDKRDENWVKSGRALADNDIEREARLILGFRHRSLLARPTQSR